jgi:DNA-binding NarL/FixJ family response regulator
MLRCHRTSRGNPVGWLQFVWGLDWTGGANDTAKGFVTSTSAGSSTPIGVLVADSNQMQCQLLVSARRRRSELQITSCILDPDVILHAIDSLPVQVAVLNADSPRDGWPDMTVIRRMHLARPEVAKIILLDTYDREVVVNAFRSGARGLFCFSQYPFRLLCKCIQCVHQGQVWANTEQMQYLVEALSQVPSLHMVNSRGIRLLTPREEQVVALVADGLSNREVARELCLSEHTIKKYLFRIFDKLGISSRVELVLYALSHGGPRQAEWVAGFGA